jgi:hypothetical protein
VVAPAASASGVRAPAATKPASDGRVRVAQAGPNSSAPRRSILARFPEATPAQEVRWAVSNANAQGAIAKAEAAIPGYRPRPSLTETIEGEIARNEADARDAEIAIEEVLVRQGRESSATRAGPRAFADVLMPQGTIVGRRSKGAGMEVRTVSRAEFDRVLRELTDGATELAPPRSNYKGLWYRRADGTIIGVRRSDGSGLTIDIIDSQRSPLLGPGTRIHSDD